MVPSSILHAVPVAGFTATFEPIFPLVLLGFCGLKHRFNVGPRALIGPMRPLVGVIQTLRWTLGEVGVSSPLT